ncbi:FeoB-associated Cys-rich membrane protein [Clostridium akagii]|uniref:FeoB-associated Cys-rich membrane protein n=1 Tax=Clostridium akagii TaxID=91623 RepID=UPI000A036E2E|nr:FeoB-associated Cys-rich membrane protein [Clostridium akagii]
MIIEIIVSGLIIIAAVVIFVKNIKKQASGECNCGSSNCSSSCASANQKKKITK